MTRLNNKGQTLVLFIVILPLILLILLLVIDIGFVYGRKIELDNINKMAISYGLDRINKVDIKEKIEEYIKLNDDNLDSIDIRIVDDEVLIEIIDNCEGVISKIVGKDYYEVKSVYKGIWSGKKKDIKVVE